MDKLTLAEIAPLVVNGQAIRFTQAEFTDAPTDTYFFESA